MSQFYFNPLTERALKHAIDTNTPALLIGETGTGKTSAIRTLAQENNTTLIRLNLTGQTGVDEILGKWIVQNGEMVWLDGMLVEAMRKGYWIVLDEINMALPEILSALHSLLDDDRSILLKEKDGELVKPVASFRFFATMNPPEDYAGTKELNRAFLSRFAVVLDIPYSPQEAQIVVEQGMASEEDAKMLTTLADQLRSSRAKSIITTPCSTRDLIATAMLISKGFSRQEAVQVAIINKSPTDERETIAKIAELITGDKFELMVKNTPHIFTSLDEVQDSINKLEQRTQSLEHELDRANKQAQDYRKHYSEANEVIQKYSYVLNAIKNSTTYLTGKLSADDRKYYKQKLTEALEEVKKLNTN